MKNWCARWFGSSPSLTPAPRHLQTSGPLWPLSLEKGRENNCSKRKQPGEANPRRSTAGRKQGQDDVSMSQLQTIVAFCFRMKSRYSVFKPLPRNSPQKGACLFFRKFRRPNFNAFSELSALEVSWAHRMASIAFGSSIQPSTVEICAFCPRLGRCGLTAFQRVRRKSAGTPTRPQSCAARTSAQFFPLKLEDDG